MKLIWAAKNVYESKSCTWTGIFLIYDIWMNHTCELIIFKIDSEQSLNAQIRQKPGQVL